MLGGPRAVLLRSGHLQDDTSVDTVVDATRPRLRLPASRIGTNNLRGTDWMLFSPIASFVERC